MSTVGEDIRLWIEANIGLFVLAVVCAVMFVVMILVLILYCCFCRKKRTTTDTFIVRVHGDGFDSSTNQLSRSTLEVSEESETVRVRQEERQLEKRLESTTIIKAEMKAQERSPQLDEQRNSREDLEPVGNTYYSSESLTRKLPRVEVDRISEDRFEEERVEQQNEEEEKVSVAAVQMEETPIQASVSLRAEASVETPAVKTQSLQLRSEPEVKVPQTYSMPSTKMSTFYRAPSERRSASVYQSDENEITIVDSDFSDYDEDDTTNTRYQEETVTMQFTSQIESQPPAKDFTDGSENYGWQTIENQTVSAEPVTTAVVSRLPENELADQQEVDSALDKFADFAGSNSSSSSSSSRSSRRGSRDESQIEVAEEQLVPVDRSEILR